MTPTPSRRQSNIGQDVPLGDTLLADTRQQLALYDQLPKDWKLIVDSLPVKIDMREVNGVLETYGPDRGLMLMVSALVQAYPNWSPPPCPE